MFFDTLAGMVERHLPEHVETLKRAHVFRMGKTEARTTISDSLEKWRADERTMENFRLPFKTVVIEEAGTRSGNSSTCAVLSMVDQKARLISFIVGGGAADNRYLATGTYVALPNLDSELSFTDDIVRITSIRLFLGDKKAGLEECQTSTAWASIDIDDQINELNVRHLIHQYENGELSREAVKEVLKWSKVQLHEYLSRARTRNATLNCAVSVLQVLLINTPSTFIVEERPLKPPKENPNTSIKRSDGRPHFIVLTPHEIRKRLIYHGKSEAEIAEIERVVTPHERRGHFRTYQSDKFVHMKGQTRWIDAMWVGPEEAVVGKNHYKVRIDL
jgi:hypothetical protein